MPSSGGRGRRYLTQWELTRMLEVLGRTPSVVSALTVRPSSLDQWGTGLARAARSYKSFEGGTIGAGM